MQRDDLGAASRGTGCPAPRHAAAIRAGMSPGGRNRGVVRVDDRAARRQRRGGGQQVARSRPASPARSQVRSDSCSSHSPITLRRYRTVPSTPPSLVKFAARLSSVSTGASSSTPTSDQVPQEM